MNGEAHLNEAARLNGAIQLNGAVQLDVATRLNVAIRLNEAIRLTEMLCLTAIICWTAKARLIEKVSLTATAPLAEKARLGSAGFPGPQALRPSKFRHSSEVRSDEKEKLVERIWWLRTDGRWRGSFESLTHCWRRECCRRTQKRHSLKWAATEESRIFENAILIT